MESENSSPESLEKPSPNPDDKRLSGGSVDSEGNSTIHPFNESNITVLEIDNNNVKDNQNCCNKQFDGSDSGVEIIENNEQINYQRALSSNSGNSQDLIQSCDSSIISCCSNYEEAYNLLVRRNSTLLEDYQIRHNDGISENGSESSSITTGSSSSLKRRNLTNVKKKLINTDISNSKSKLLILKNNKPPITPARIKSIDRLQGKTLMRSNSIKKTPNSLDIKNRASSTGKSPSSVTPTDDGRWPSVNSKPAPLLSRSIRGIIEANNNKINSNNKNDTKTIEKYATLPRPKKKEKSSDDLEKKSSLDTFNRKKQARDSLRVINVKKKQKIKIYHEISAQTALTMSDMEKALAGIHFGPVDPKYVEKVDQDIQVDMRLKDLEQLQIQLKQMTEKYETLNQDYKQQNDKLIETENKLRQEIVEKDGLKEELKINTQRVLDILGEGTNDDDKVSSDSLMVLENRFQNVSQIVIRQEEEISKLNVYCRSLQIDLEKSQGIQKVLIQQQQDLEAESVELQEFMQAEKTTLSDALKEAETEISRLSLQISNKDKELNQLNDDCKRYQKLNEQKWQENLTLQAKFSALEAKSRELLVHQGSSVSGASVALSALIGRLEGLVDELVASYNISEQELEDVIFHNEAYSNSSSSPDATPEKYRKFLSDRTPSPKTKGSTFVSAVINAIKNAAAQTPFTNNSPKDLKDNSTDKSSSNEMLDSETEPCLMMEHVLEDVIIPDGHSHNMISSCHSLLSSKLSNSETSFNNLSQSFNKKLSTSLTTSLTSDNISICDIFPSLTLIDQVIDVDNLITRLLKVIRIIQLDNDDCMNDLQNNKDKLIDKINKQESSNKIIVKQLKDWEILGARLKTEVKELMQQLSKKNNEMDNLKQELNNHREQVEKLNQDVCVLSTALSKASSTTTIITTPTTTTTTTTTNNQNEDDCDKNKWEKLDNQHIICTEITNSQNEVSILREKLKEKENQLNELSKEFLANRKLLTESLKVAVNEAKKQYTAIDHALEVLHNNQSIVQQCQQLSELQHDLETTNFQSASVIPLVGPADCNANAGLLQSIGQVASPINTTA